MGRRRRRVRSVMVGRGEGVRGAVDESEDERRVCTQGEDCESEKVCSGLEEHDVEIQAFSPVYERQRRRGEEGLDITIWVTFFEVQWWVQV